MTAVGWGLRSPSGSLQPLLATLRGGLFYFFGFELFQPPNRLAISVVKSTSVSPEAAPQSLICRVFNGDSRSAALTLAWGRGGLRGFGVALAGCFKRWFGLGAACSQNT